MAVTLQPILCLVIDGGRIRNKEIVDAAATADIFKTKTDDESLVFDGNEFLDERKSKNIDKTDVECTGGDIWKNNNLLETLYVLNIEDSESFNFYDLKSDNDDTSSIDTLVNSSDY